MTNELVERITHNSELLAIIVRAEFRDPGIHFFTENDLSQQLGYMRHPKGKVIIPHVHNPVPREVHYTQEVLLIRRGSVRVDFYNDKQAYLESRILRAGDFILLATGGHGFVGLEEFEMIEVKQGPHAGDADKTRFTPVDESLLKIKD
jgi:mannose-6-phosphate isomerase-like protein (cupin superfamily)